MVRILLSLAVAGVVVVGCGSKTEPTAPAPNAAADGSFARVATILNNRCVNCHAGARAPEKLDLTSYATLMKGTEKEKVVAEGDPDNSLIVHVLRARNGEKQMPPGGPIPEEDIQAIEAWIKAGAKG